MQASSSNLAYKMSSSLVPNILLKLGANYSIWIHDILWLSWKELLYNVRLLKQRHLSANSPLSLHWQAFHVVFKSILYFTNRNKHSSKRFIDKLVKVTKNCTRNKNKNQQIKSKFIDTITFLIKELILF